MNPFSLEEYLKNPDREVVTRDGGKVRIICTDFDNPDFPVVGEIKGHKWPSSFTINGLLIKGAEHIDDLFFAPEKHEGWMNLYRSLDGKPQCGFIYDSEAEAKSNGRNALATIKVEWEE